MGMERVVVTGGAGVIGRELLARLARRDCEILCLDREPLPQPAPPNVRFIQVDLAKGGMDEIASFAPHTIYHLAAAFERAQETPDFWEANYRDNLLVTHRLHDLIRRLPGLRHYVFASSYLIYQPELYLFPAPREDARALDEDAPVRPRNLCGAAKYLAEREIDFLVEVDRRPLSCVSARIFRVYGRGSRDVISRWVRALLSDEPVVVYNPENRFDYIFAGDVAEGLIRLRDAATPGHRIVNLARGRAHRVADVLGVLGREFNQLSRLRQDAAAEERHEASVADLARLKTLTGWRPATSLEDGIAKVVAFERAKAGNG